LGCILFVLIVYFEMLHFAKDDQMRDHFQALLPLAIATCLAMGQSPSASSQHSVSFENVLGMTYVHASVNGSRPLTMVLDSGASYSVLQPKIGAELNLKAGGREQATGLGANATLQMVRGATVRFAGETLTEQTISMLPLDFLESEGGHETDGALGFNIFLKFDILENYGTNRVTLIPPAEFNAPKGYTSIPVIVSGNNALVQLTVGATDGKPVKGLFLIDSGGMGNIVLRKTFVDANPALQPKKLFGIPSVTAVGGRLDIASGALGLLGFGDYSMHDLQATFLRTENPGFPAVAGLLCTGILRRFDVIFDFPHAKLWLKPNANFDKPIVAGVGSSILLKVKPPLYDVVLVRDVISGSPAAHAGVRPGDRIVRIRVGAGKSLEATSLAQVYKALAKPGEHVTLYLIRDSNHIKISF
jgi:hypothetical protein